MAAQRTSKPIDTAFGILFLLLIVVSVLQIAGSADVAGQQSPAMLQMTADLERLRVLDQDLTSSIEHLRSTSLAPDAKATVLNLELERIEDTIHNLGSSTVPVSGLTRLVEPYTYIHHVRTELVANGLHGDSLASISPTLERALVAAQFVVRNNITRLGSARTVMTASLNGSSSRTRWLTLLGGLAAVLVFAPVRLLAQRAAAKPIQSLKAATRAVAEERWNAVQIECQPDDAVGELVSAFNTMASTLRQSREERASTFRRTLASLVQAIEAKDEYVSNHSNNVSQYAELLARAMKLPQHQVNEIACGGLLHDIGKIGIPDEIINKPGRLSSQEFGVIEEHPVIGDRIVKPLDGSDVLLPPVRHHHEHWDGTGYPDKLRGEEIPLPARIMAVADVFEALTSDRPYRKRMTVDEATGILREESGKTLDPELVDLFIAKVLPQIKPKLLEKAKQDAVAQAKPLHPQTQEEDLHPVASS